MRRYEIAWRMNEVIMSMNNEEAYYDSGWLEIWPDDCDLADCKSYFDDEEGFKELKKLYLEVFSEYHKDGLYKALPSVYDYALITCIELNLAPIENLGL